MNDIYGTQGTPSAYRTHGTYGTHSTYGTHGTPKKLWYGAVVGDKTVVLSIGKIFFFVVVFLFIVDFVDFFNATVFSKLLYPQVRYL